MSHKHTIDSESPQEILADAEDHLRHEEDESYRPGQATADCDARTLVQECRSDLYRMTE